MKLVAEPGAFAVTEDVRDQARIVKIVGEFDATVAAPAEARLSRASADRERVLVIDLLGCTFVDSTGLAAIVGAARALCNGQIKIAIACQASSGVRATLRLTGIDRTVPILPTVEEALEAALATD